MNSIFENSENFVNTITGPASVEINNPPIIFPYKCDDFQKHAFVCISNNENLLVTAHTGSGKTTIAEYAIAHTINKGMNVVYTSPIKSLSNEKYNDFKKKFSDNAKLSLGILTGDNKINPDGNCLIMTAEILKNTLYRLKSKSFENIDYIHDIKKNFIDKIGCVIIDEVHFINDHDRGKVWEETIVLLNRDVQLILLSATINQPENFAKWIGNIKQKKINLISTTYRAVPLEHYIYTGDKLYHIFDPDGNYKQSEYTQANKEYSQSQKIRQLKHKSDINLNQIQDIIKYLQKYDMLQAIFFSFSKKNCERYAQMITDSLVDLSDMKEIECIFNKYMHTYEKRYEHIEQYKIIKKIISKGIAFHHSGLLSILKEIIEIIFHKGLIKVLFATETFSVGVNMPTRTVIFTELEKFTHEGKRSLNTAEYKQMSGRAGRRGIDTSGNVIILPIYNFPDDQLLKNLLMGSVPHISSQFKIDYQFFLKAIQSESTDISSFLKDSLMMAECKQMIVANEKELETLNNQLKLFDLNSIQSPQLDKIKELYKLQNNDDSIYGIKVTMSKAQSKRLNSLKSEINKNSNMHEIYNKYCSHNQIKFKYDECLKNINSWKSYSDKLLKNVERILVINGFIAEDMSILKKGIIAAQINECNAIILTEMITRGSFKGLSSEEIVALLALFIEESKSDDKLSFNDIKVTGKLGEHIKNIITIIDSYILMEKNIGILDNEKYWEISFDFIDIAYNWVNETINQESPTRMFESFENVYIGNFIRNMIKINNIVKDLIYLFQINGDNEIIPILEKIGPLIMKDFVTVNSLYLIK